MSPYAVAHTPRRRQEPYSDNGDSSPPTIRIPFPQVDAVLDAPIDESSGGTPADHLTDEEVPICVEVRQGGPSPVKALPEIPAFEDVLEVPIAAEVPPQISSPVAEVEELALAEIILGPLEAHAEDVATIEQAVLVETAPESQFSFVEPFEEPTLVEAPRERHVPDDDLSETAPSAENVVEAIVPTSAILKEPVPEIELMRSEAEVKIAIEETHEHESGAPDKDEKRPILIEETEGNVGSASSKGKIQKTPEEIQILAQSLEDEPKTKEEVADTTLGSTLVSEISNHRGKYRGAEEDTG